MSDNSQHELGKVLGLILGRGKCLMNCTPGVATAAAAPPVVLPPAAAAAVPPEATRGRPRPHRSKVGVLLVKVELELLLVRRRRGGRLPLAVLRGCGWRFEAKDSTRICSLFT